jgi:hypothetical protein
VKPAGYKVVLYIRTALDPPHSMRFAEPGRFRCGQPVAGAYEISENQALVYLDNARCPGCFPGYAQRGGNRA